MSGINPDAWLAELNSKDAEGQFEFIIDTLKKDLGELNEEVDIMDVILELSTNLEKDRAFDRYEFLLETLKKHQPDIYEEEFSFLEPLRLNWLLFEGIDDKLDSSIEPFSKAPNRDVDGFLNVLKTLSFYGKTHRVKDLAEKAFKPIREDNSLSPHIGQDVSTILLACYLEETYRSENPNWEDFANKTKLIGFPLGEFPELLKEGLSWTATSTPKQLPEAGPDRDRYFVKLHASFQRFMWDTHQVGFHASELIWSNAIGYFGKNNGVVNDPNRFFAVGNASFDEFLGELAGFFEGHNRTEAIGTMWGMALISDFLFQFGLIDKIQRDKNVNAIKPIKEKFKNNYREHLWQYAYVHLLGKPDTVSDKFFEQEQQQFEDSF